MPKVSPRISSVDALLGLGEHAASEQDVGNRGLVYLPPSKIRYFHKHPFRLYTGERLADLVESITAHGILIPTIVRRIEPDADGFSYEMLAGHNRHNGATIAGLSVIPCIDKGYLSDADAWIYVIETNVFQRSFNEMLPSEKAAVLAMQYSDMFSQGKRNDIQRELRLLENPHSEDTDTCGTQFHKLSSREALGQEYGLTGRAVASYLCVHKLTDSLKLRLDNGEMTLKSGVSLSYLSESNQKNVDHFLQNHNHKLSDAQAATLRRRGATEVLTLASIQSMLENKTREMPAHLQIRQELYAPYFTENTPTKEIEQVIAKALQFYFTHHKKEESA